MLQPKPILDDATPHDTTVDMRDPEPTLGERLVGALGLQGPLHTAWLLRRHADRHLGKRARPEAQLRQQPASRGQGRARRVSHGKRYRCLCAYAVTEWAPASRAIARQVLPGISHTNHLALLSVVMQRRAA